MSGGPTYAQILEGEIAEICSTLGCDPRSPGAVREALLSIERLKRERDEARTYALAMTQHRDNVLAELVALRDCVNRVVAAIGTPLLYDPVAAFGGSDKDGDK